MGVLKLTVLEKARKDQQEKMTLKVLNSKSKITACSCPAMIYKRDNEFVCDDDYSWNID